MQPTTREDLQSSLDRARQILTDLDRSRRQTADLKTKITTHVPALLPMPKKPEWTGWRGALKIAASVVVAFLAVSFFVYPLAADAVRGAYVRGVYDGNTALAIFSVIALLLLIFGVPVATPFVLRGIRKQQNEKIEAINAEREADLARDLETAACNNQQVVNQLNDPAQFMEVLRMAWQAEVAPLRTMQARSPITLAPLPGTPATLPTGWPLAAALPSDDARKASRKSYGRCLLAA